MRNPTYEQEDEFLSESNAIEGVRDEGAFLDARKAWEYVRKQPLLTIPVVLETHRILMEKQPIPSHSLGYWRSCRVYIGGREGMTWQNIPLAIEEWIGAMNSPVPKDFGGTESWSRELHVRYEKIHPFIDGNGRTGRMFMNWWRLRNNLPLLIIHEGEEQMDYYTWFKD